MPTYILDEGAAVRLPRGALTIALQASGPANQVRIQAIRDGQEVPADAVIRPRPGLLVIPQVSSRTVIRVVPTAPLRVFGPVTVSLTIAVDRRSEPDPERAVVSAVDVAGLGQRDLVALESDDQGTIVSGMGGDDTSDAISGLADAARVAAREILGVDRVPAVVATNVVVALDQSASMRGSLADGSVAAVLDVIAGVTRVLCNGRRVAACLMTSPVTWLGDVDAGALATTVVNRSTGESSVVGFSAAEPSLRGFAPDENTVTYVVTDGVPADVEALAQEDAIDGEARHLVLLQPRTAWDVRDATPEVPTTVVEPGTRDRSLADTLLAEPMVLRDVVRSLLAGCFAPGTPMAGRVAR